MSERRFSAPRAIVHALWRLFDGRVAASRPAPSRDEIAQTCLAGADAVRDVPPDCVVKVAVALAAQLLAHAVALYANDADQLDP